MQCNHCGLSSGPSSGFRRGKKLNTSEAIKLFYDLDALGVRRLIISGGEFTTRKDWQNLLQKALNIFETVRVISNGWLGYKLLEEISTLDNLQKLFLSLSLDGAREVHDKNRRIGSFERVIDVLSAKSQIVRTVITTVTNNNYDELDEIYGLLQRLNVPVWSVQLGLPEGRMKAEDFIGEVRIKELADRILGWQTDSDGKMEVIPDDCFGYHHPAREIYPWKGCPAGRNLITILSDGSITGCPTMFDRVVGNIRTQDIQEIWDSPEFKNIREPIHCSNCDNKSCHGGCRAVQKIFGKQFCF